MTHFSAIPVAGDLAIAGVVSHRAAVLVAGTCLNARIIADAGAVAFTR
jgi:hypothetical protein